MTSQPSMSFPAWLGIARGGCVDACLLEIINSSKGKFPRHTRGSPAQLTSRENGFFSIQYD